MRGKDVTKMQRFEREFAVGLYGEKYTTVCPECRAIDESRMKKETAQMVDLIVRIETFGENTGVCKTNIAN
jgi:hypothetical protein